MGSSPVARHYWGNHVCFLFLEVLRCFSSLGWRHRKLPTAAVLQTAGLSHSEIPGSEVICTYPGLIAAYHVLHRLHEPRHPPCALYYFRFPAKRPDAHTFSSSSHLHRTCGAGVENVKRQKVRAAPSAYDATGPAKQKVSKGAWWMPWLTEAMKDVISCDKPRVGANDL